MLLGQYDSKLTDKDRIVVPKKFREELGDQLIIARWYENCLVLVSLADWKELRRKLVGTKEMVTTSVRDIGRFVSGMAYELKADAQGRILVPGKLLEHAGIKNEVVFVGLEDRVEIWSKDNWMEFEKNIEKKASEAIEKIAKEEKNVK